MRHIAWFNEALIEPAPGGELTSPDATVRRRCLAPAREIEKMGIGCSVFGHLKNADPVEVSNHLQKLRSDIVVIGAMSCPNTLKLARAAKHLGCYVVVDAVHDENTITDQAKLWELTDQIVASDADQAVRLMEQTGLAIVVIPDSDENMGGEFSPPLIAKKWLELFKNLHNKPPHCANSNTPHATKV